MSLQSCFTAEFGFDFYLVKLASLTDISLYEAALKQSLLYKVLDFKNCIF